MKNLYFTIIFAALAHMTIAQPTYRQVAWVHGFGGKYCSLDKLEDHFERMYEISSVKAEYSTQNGIEESGDEVGGHLARQFDPNDPKNLGIGHSMGGLNLRHTEFGNPRVPLGGIITIGTPHGGAEFAENYLNGGLDKFVRKMTESLLAGPKADKYASAFLYNLDRKLDLPLIEMLQSESIGLMDIINMMGRGQSLDFLNELLASQQSIEDLAPGSHSLENLNGRQSARKGYAIWGEEDSPVHWRFLSSLISAECEAEPDAKTDELLIDKLDRLEDLYTAMESTNRAACQAIYAMLFGLVKKKNIDVCKIANKYELGKNWLRNSEEEWLKLIGGLRKEKQMVRERRFVCRDEIEIKRRGNEFKAVSRELLNNEDCWADVWVEREVWIKEPSDGLVTKRSATALPGVIQTVKAEGTNHFELLYQQSVIDALSSIFDQIGEWPYVARK